MTGAKTTCSEVSGMTSIMASRCAAPKLDVATLDKTSPQSQSSIVEFR